VVGWHGSLNLLAFTEIQALKVLVKSFGQAFAAPAINKCKHSLLTFENYKHIILISLADIDEHIEKILNIQEGIITDFPKYRKLGDCSFHFKLTFERLGHILVIAILETAPDTITEKQ
jgi:hypothetical protein